MRHSASMSMYAIMPVCHHEECPTGHHCQLTILLKSLWLIFISGTPLQTRINFYPSMISKYSHYKVWDKITQFPFPAARPLQPGNGQVISPHILLGM